MEKRSSAQGESNAKTAGPVRKPSDKRPRGRKGPKPQDPAFLDWHAETYLSHSQWAHADTEKRQRLANSLLLRSAQVSCVA